MSGKKRLEMHKKAKGGKAVDEHGKGVNEYNAKGSPEVSEAKNEKEGFKKGGMAKKKDGGHAEGKKSHKRLDKAKRGGHIKKHAAGGSPFTMAAKRDGYSNKSTGDGHVDQKGAMEEKQMDKDRP